MTKILNEVESYELFQQYGIDVLPYHICKSLDEAIASAEELSYPLVMKVVSRDILHKTDIGGVYTGITTFEELKDSWKNIHRNIQKNAMNAVIDGILLQKMGESGVELIYGVKKDDQFGPVVVFGMGGIYAEAVEDTAIRVLPVDDMDVLDMMSETKIYKILTGARGKEYDINAAKNIILNISKLVQDNPNLVELDINPVFVYEKKLGAYAADGLVIC